ncbi:MAG: xanthine dehydrogenase small subunit [Betaproteobacteria bacterium]|nr:xanthine dehydrogenase small subunit [Betaproteobacteria bacterium]
MPARRSIRFILDGEVVQLDDVAPTMTVLEYLREKLGRTGTKEGCAEGDCGACTVVIGEPAAGKISYRAINSCIRFLPTLDGKEIVTVENLKSADGKLHPVQQAMVDWHASQCGFCTPGFVMSLFGLYLNEAAPQRDDVVRALSGNLCRCTGYRPIIDAGCRMSGYADPASWSRAYARDAKRHEALEAIAATDTVSLDGGAGFRAPVSIDELARLCEAHPQALLLAGGTDIGLWVTKQLRDLPMLIYTGNVAELRSVRETGNAVEIGAAVSLTDAYAAIVARYPMLAELADRFGSPPVRNSGTLGGNVANGSPIGDSMPFLLVLGATVKLRRGGGEREMPLEDFYLGYQKTALQPGEFVEAVRIPLSPAGRRFASYKISKRFDQDISALCGAYAFDLEDGRIAKARIAYGGMAAVPKRAMHTEAALIDQPWSRATMEAALSALALDYAPLTDMRASAEYRMLVAQNLLLRFFAEHSGKPVPTRVAELEEH